MTPRKLVGISLFAILALRPAATAGHALHVPGDHASIGAAVAAAVEGDSILVGPGVWSGVDNRQIDLGGRNMTVRSTAGAGSTTIDCARQAAGFVITGGQTSATRIEGFTIQNGNPAGVLVTGASPEIRNCTMETCFPSGIYCSNAPATIWGCILQGSSRGLTLVGSNATVTGCAITSNGTGVADGGGVSCNASGAVFTACSILSNVAGVRGGGVYCQGSPSPAFYVCSIAGNEAPRGGGGFVASGSPRFELCSIAGNRGTLEGGGIACSASSAEFLACTISRNDAQTGAGIHLADATVSMTRTILWGNCGHTLQGKDAYLDATSELTVACCAIDSTGNAGSGTIHEDGDQIHTDPRFCNMGPCASEPTIQGNFYLAFDSPCVTGPCGDRIGAYDAACVETPVSLTTWGRVRASFR